MSSENSNFYSTPYQCPYNENNLPKGHYNEKINVGPTWSCSSGEKVVYEKLIKGRVPFR